MPYRYQKHFHRNRQNTMTEALDKGVLGWAIDYQTLIELAVEGIDVIVYYVQDTRELYLTYRERFLHAQKWNYAHAGGTDQRALPLEAFTPFKMKAKRARRRKT